jgi:hypothetical protein
MAKMKYWCKIGDHCIDLEAVEHIVLGRGHEPADPEDWRGKKSPFILFETTTGHHYVVQFATVKEAEEEFESVWELL